MTNNTQPTPSHQRGRLAKLAFMTCAATALLAGSAFASNFRICATYESGPRVMTVKVSNSCISSSYRYKGEDITASTSDTSTALMIDGGFQYQPLPEGRRIVSADCGGRRSKTLTLNNMAPRRYVVLAGGQGRGILDFADATGVPQTICLEPAQNRAIVQSTFFPPLSADLKGRLNELKARAPGSIAKIIQPLLDEVSPEGEGLGAFDVHAETMAAGQGQGKRAVVRVSGHGFADDSVSGARYEVHLAQTDNGLWTPVNLKRWWMCARGEQAGQWTMDKCS